MLIFRGRMPDPSKFLRHHACLMSVLFALVANFPISHAAAAQEASPLTLQEAEELALSDEPGQNSLRLRAGALRDESVVGGQLPDPTMRVGIANFACRRRAGSEFADIARGGGAGAV